MKYAITLTIAIVIALAALMHSREQQAGREAAEAQIAVWQAKYAEASTARRVDSVETVKWITKTRTLRDTVLTMGTIVPKMVTEYIYQTDTLRAVCLRCLASSAALQRASDSLSLALSAERDYWRQSAIRSSKTVVKWQIVSGAAFVLGVWVGK